MVHPEVLRLIAEDKTAGPKPINIERYLKPKKIKPPTKRGGRRLKRRMKLKAMYQVEASLDYGESKTIWKQHIEDEKFKQRHPVAETTCALNSHADGSNKKRLVVNESSILSADDFKNWEEFKIAKKNQEKEKDCST